MLFSPCNSKITSRKENCRVFCLIICLIAFLFQQVSNNTVREALISWITVIGQTLQVASQYWLQQNCNQFSMYVWQFGISFAVFCLIAAFCVMGRDCLGCSLTMVAVIYSSTRVMLSRTLTLFHRSINMCFPATSRLGIDFLTASWTNISTYFAVLWYIIYTYIHIYT